MIFAAYPGHLVALILVLASGGILFAAFHTSRLRTPQHGRYRLLLAGIHSAAVVMLLVILWDPSTWQRKETFGRNTVLAVFDTSESMSVADEGRAARLDRSLSRFAECLDTQGESGPRFRIYGFDDRAYHCGSADLLQRWGSRSNLHEVFALIEDGAAHDAPAGVVVFTDGRAEDRDPRRYLPPPKDGPPILLVGVGARSPRPDIAVTAISSPAVARVDTAYDVAVAVAAANAPNAPVTLELVCDDKVVETRRLGREQFRSSDSGPAEALVEFVLPAPRLGTQVLTARVKLCPGEINLANNSRSASVEVTQERPLRVLLYTQWASFDVGKIRQALAWDKRFRVDLGFDVIRDSPLADRASQASGYVTLSNISARYSEYDVIILGACEVGLGDGDLYDFIARRGGGLILLPGATVESLATAGGERTLATLPVLFGRTAPESRPQASMPGQGIGMPQPAPRPQSPTRVWPPQREAIELTFESQVGRVFDPEVFADSKSRVSPYYEIAQVKPAATVLATAGDTPMVSVQRLGRGRVCLLNASKLFLLYREDRQGGALSELVCSLVAYLGRTPSQGAGVELFAARTADDPRRVAFHAYVVDKAFEPVAAANVLLRAGEQVVSMEPTGRGYYKAMLDWGSAQSVIVTAQAELNGSFLGERTLAANLPPVRDEMSCVDLDEPFLRALAERIGARYVHIDQLDENAAKLFVPRRQVGTTEAVDSVWPRWPVLAILCVLLSTGWFIRRAIGLV